MLCVRYIGFPPRGMARRQAKWDLTDRWAQSPTAREKAVAAAEDIADAASDGADPIGDAPQGAALGKALAVDLDHYPRVRVPSRRPVLWSATPCYGEHLLVTASRTLSP